MDVLVATGIDCTLALTGSLGARCLWKVSGRVPGVASDSGKAPGKDVSRSQLQDSVPRWMEMIAERSFAAHDQSLGPSHLASSRLC